MDDKENPYVILGITDGPAATEADIKKAYRALALKKHPDKNKNNPNAAAEFAQLEQAYRVLTDAQARGALDDVLKAKAERAAKRAGENELKRKFREDLERREKKVMTERREEDNARVRLAEELERVRKQMAEEAAQRAAVAQQAAAAAVAAAAGPAPDDPSLTESMRCTVKTSWDPDVHTYTAEDLRALFSAHGRVVDVVVRERKSAKGASKSRPKASALVVFSSPAEAACAASSVNGDPHEPLLVVPLAKISVDALHSSPTGPGAGVSNGGTAPGQPAIHAQGPSLFPAAAPGMQQQQQQSSRLSPEPLQPPLAGKPLFPLGQAGKPLFPAAAGVGPQQQQQGGLEAAAASKGPAPPGQGPASSFPAFPIGGAGAAVGGRAPPPPPASTFPAAAAGMFASFPGVPRGVAGIAAQGKEADILDKMRRAAERERQLREAAAEDG